MPLERRLELAEGVVQRARLSSEDSPAARTARKRREALEAARVPLVPVEQLTRLISTAELNQRLDVVDDEAHRSRLAEVFTPRKIDIRLKSRCRRLGVSSRELDMTECPARGELGGASGGLGHQRERALGGCRRVLRATSLSCSEALDSEVVCQGHGLSGLGRELLPRPGVRERGVIVAEDAVEEPRQRQDVRRGALVAQLARSIESMVVGISSALV